MMNKALSELIDRYERPKSFNHAAFTPEMHEQVGAELGLSLPEQYLAFIERYGHSHLETVPFWPFPFTGQRPALSS